MKNYFFRIGIAVLLSFILTACVKTNDYVFFKPLKNTVFDDDVLFVKNINSFELDNYLKSVLKKFLKPISSKKYFSFVPDDNGKFDIHFIQAIMYEYTSTKENVPFFIDEVDIKNAVVSFVGENQGIQYFNISFDSNDVKEFSEKCFNRSIESIIKSHNITLNKSIIESQNLKKIMNNLDSTIYNSYKDEIVSAFNIKCFNLKKISTSGIFNFMLAFDPKTENLYIMETPKLISLFNKGREYTSDEYKKNIYENLPKLNIYSKYSRTIGKKESSFLGLHVGATIELNKAIKMRVTDELLFILTNK